MGGDAGSMLGNIAGRVLGVLSALPSRGGGFSNLANYMAKRQEAMSDPNKRAGLTPFSAGFYNIGGGMEPGPAGPPTVGAVAAPSDFMGPTIPTPAGPAQSLFVQPGQPGPSVWKAHLPALAPEAEVEQQQYRQLVADIYSPDLATRARAKQTAKIPLTAEETQALIADARQLVQNAPPGSTASVGPGGVTVTVGSPYPQGTYQTPEGATVPGHLPPVVQPGGGAKPGDIMRSTEWLTEAEAAARRQPGEITQRTNRNTFENVKQEPAGVAPIAPAPAAPPVVVAPPPPPPPVVVAPPPPPPPPVVVTPPPPPPPAAAAPPPVVAAPSPAPAPAPPSTPPPTLPPHEIVRRQPDGSFAVVPQAAPAAPPPGTVGYPSPAFALSAAPPPGAVSVGLPEPQITPTTPGMVQPVAQVTPTTAGPPGAQARLPVYPAAGFVFHHSGGSTLAGLRDTLQKRGLGSQYLMDRDGTIYSFAGAGSPHIRPNDQFHGIAPGLSNANAVGMEIVAKDDQDITPAQVASARNFIATNYPDVKVYGHGEVNPGHKQADEGMTVVSAIRNDRVSGLGLPVAEAPGQVAVTPAAAPQPIPRAPGSVDLTAPVFRQIEQARGLPAGTLSGMAEKESGGDPKAASASSSARGLFQITKDTARAWGISANDRYDPIRSAIATADQLAQRAQVVGFDRAIGMHYGGPGAPYAKPIAGQSPAGYSADVQRRAAKYAQAASPAELGLVAFPSPAFGGEPQAAVVAPVPVRAAPAPEVLMTPVPRRPSLLGGMPPAMLPPEPQIGYPPPAPQEGRPPVAVVASPAAVPWAPSVPGAPGRPIAVPVQPPAPAAVVVAPPPGMPAGATKFTQTQPIKPDAGGGTVTVTGDVPGAEKEQTAPKGGFNESIFLRENGIDPAKPPKGTTEALTQYKTDYERRIEEAKQDVQRRYGKVGEAQTDTGVRLRTFRSYVNTLLDEFTPEERARYVGMGGLTPILKGGAFSEDPRFLRFRSLNAALRTSVFAEAGKAVTAPELALLAPTLPSGKEPTDASYEAALQLTTDKLDRLITGYDALANVRVEDLTPAKQRMLIEQYLSAPDAPRYGPYQWARGGGVLPPEQRPGATTTTTLPPSPFVVDRLYTLPPPAR